LTTWTVAISSLSVREDDLARQLRQGEPAVVARVKDGKLLIDVRTVFAEQEDALIEAVRRALQAAV
jgi:L-seryl-tRNA(Ser) seleniumtransferase